jgi:hypothetical protein
MNFKQIADWLNDNNYKTPRGKKFLNAHAISIVAKKQRRDAKLAKRFPLKLSNFSIHLVDKTLINKNEINYFLCLAGKQTKQRRKQNRS